MSDTRLHVHELVDRLQPAQLTAVAGLLETMIDPDEEILSEEDRRAVAASLEYFRNGGEGVSFEQVVADCGFTMEEIRSRKGK